MVYIVQGEEETVRTQKEKRKIGNKLVAVQETIVKIIYKLIRARRSIVSSENIKKIKTKYKNRNLALIIFISLFN